jgi:hypothetical protein
MLPQAFGQEGHLWSISHADLLRALSVLAPRLPALAACQARKRLDGGKKTRNREHTYIVGKGKPLASPARASPVITRRVKDVGFAHSRMVRQHEIRNLGMTKPGIAALALRTYGPAASWL